MRPYPRQVGMRYQPRVPSDVALRRDAMHERAVPLLASPAYVPKTSLRMPRWISDPVYKLIYVPIFVREH